MVYEPFPSKLKLEVRTDGTMRQHSPSWYIDTPQSGVQHVMIHLRIIEKRTGSMSAILFLKACGNCTTKLFQISDLTHIAMPLSRLNSDIPYLKHISNYYRYTQCL